MTDVRLTATNPEDSSVVPVACNSRGELLVTEPVINEIDNDVTIQGVLAVEVPGNETYVTPTFTIPEKGGWEYRLENVEQSISYLDEKGILVLRRLIPEAKGVVSACAANQAYAIKNTEDTMVWSVNWSGVTSGPNFRIWLEPDNPVHFSTVRTTETGEETKEYIGPVIDVREELEFLRAQVRALMEKLKMTPEGGWPVWDGSAET